MTKPDHGDAWSAEAGRPDAAVWAGAGSVAAGACTGGEADGRERRRRPAIWGSCDLDLWWRGWPAPVSGEKRVARGAAGGRWLGFLARGDGGIWRAAQVKP
jgi:hypothetical protein